ALAEARAAQRAAQRALGAALDGWDVILTSSAPGEAPRGLAETGDPVCNTLWTLAHLPSATFPAGRGPHGLPLGLQVVGHWGRDGTMLRWAAWIEAALG
ncbi:MAG: amidase, partial [Acetobacteraceae bacterium]|nr:amidase [Acetobacteraceae bacterium]